MLKKSRKPKIGFVSLQDSSAAEARMRAYAEANKTILFKALDFSFTGALAGAKKMAKKKQATAGGQASS